MKIISSIPMQHTLQKSIPNENQSKHLDFQSVLKEQQKIGSIKFSKHAEMRLQNRNIQLNAVHMKKIDYALELAHKKNIKDTLLLLDDLAFVVNVKNKTVITAIEKTDMEERVFTNIDGAIIL